ncbi:uncharacterized protein OCT59_015890 [Rhizophagus irregularis]|uniref:Hint domain-containing protein n=3 Tax=Rhizophagus irregularis TaxID=588596 RepID=A0A015NK37_RHIIW|nr:hypothetical protein RirG_002090 [Rhizophagus irregularis DAOM 197198w]UZO23556.1 hypothetical protein OCT59_015890 [Rhizophagus irregularis]GBC30741.1 hypothetical protein GLOIN_2v1658512 [Rhizophagus irregularis DAOM 181602=DAOM 197198]
MVAKNQEEIEIIKQELLRSTYSEGNSNSEEQDIGKSSSSDSEEINSFRYPAVILIGNAGVGKSTLGNWLLGYHGDGGPFETKASCDPVTLEPQTALLEISDRKYNLIDTPGLFDVKDDARSDIALTKLANTINHCSYGIQTIIFVVKKSFGKEIDRQIQAIKGFLGEKALDHILIAFTHVNMDQTMDRTVMKKSFNSRMINFLNKIDNRWIVSPNPDLFTLEDDIVYTNVYEAKDIIESFPEAYTTDMFNRVRRAREEAEEAARIKAQEERLRACEEEISRLRNNAGIQAARNEAEKQCFSLDTIVTLEGGKKIEMSEVRVGDKVACVGSNNKVEYSEVYLIAHVDKDKQAEFLKVDYTKPDGTTGCLNLTSEHHLFVNGSFDYAHNIRPNDSQIQILYKDELIPVRVTNVSKEIRKGYIGIFTRTGTIIADDVFCSCYSSCPPYQNIIHYIMAPIRFTTLFHKSNYCDSEIHPYLKFLYNNYKSITGAF